MDVKELVELLKESKSTSGSHSMRIVIYFDGSGSVEETGVNRNWAKVFGFSCPENAAQKLKSKMPSDYKSLFSVVDGKLEADFSRVEITEENALLISIAKWEVICDALDNREKIHGGDRWTCSCCQLYEDCVGCPIAEKAGFGNCEGSPLNDYYATTILFEKMKVAHAEVKFLKSLMDNQK